MKRAYKFLCLVLLCTNFWGCTNDEDKVKIVEMTIYPETGYVKPILSRTWTDALVYSESDDNEKLVLR